MSSQKTPIDPEVSQNSKTHFSSPPSSSTPAEIQSQSSTEVLEGDVIALFTSLHTKVINLQELVTPLTALVDLAKQQPDTESGLEQV